MRYFPFFADTRGRRVVIVGGNQMAAQKLRLLTRSEAHLHVIAPEDEGDIHDEIRAWAQSGRLNLERRAFNPTDVVGALAVYVTVNDEAVRMAAVEAARTEGIPANVVDYQELCDFISPALVDRDPLIVAISSDGAAPVLSRRVKSQIDRLLPHNLGRLARYAARWRDAVNERIAVFANRRWFWEWLLNGPAADHVLQGDEDVADRMVDWQLAKPNRDAPRQGRVVLVGAGPGDPELLTLKAVQHMQRADVLVIDRLVAPAVLEYARRDATRIYVGKTPGKPSIKQDEINAILLREAQAGNTVVRLKGGDPFVFGRALDELESLHAAGIPTEIVPGVTAALACAATNHIPLTRRQMANGEAFRSLVLLTGRDAEGPAEHNWAELAKPGQILAIYMGVGAAPNIQAQLLAHGIDPAAAVTVVENGTTAEEVLAHGRIDQLTALIRQADIRGPALIYVNTAPLPVPARNGQVLRPEGATADRGRAPAPVTQEAWA